MGTEVKPHRGWHSRGYLPHFDSPETVQHVVFRTLDSLPADVFSALPTDALERRRKVEAALDAGFGAKPLLQPPHATMVENAILHFDAERYQILAWCIMPNHVHVVVSQISGYPLSDIVGSWKQYSARQINLATGQKGAFWAEEY